MQEFDLTQDGKHYRISRSSDKSPFIELTMHDDPQTARSTLVRISFPVSVWEWVAKSLASLVPPNPEHTDVHAILADLRTIPAPSSNARSTLKSWYNGWMAALKTLEGGLLTTDAEQFISTPTITGQLLNAYADLTSRMIAASGALRQSTFEIEAQALWERWHPQPSGGSSS